MGKLALHTVALYKVALYSCILGGNTQASMVWSGRVV